MIFEKTCKDCSKKYGVTDEECIEGRFWREKTKEIIWLCQNCRPKNPKIKYFEDIEK